MTWAKVGNRLGYSRQRIHQLIQLLDLPDEIGRPCAAAADRARHARSPGLTPVQQRALHRAPAGDPNSGEVRQIARLLREAPEMTVAAAARLLDEAAADPSTAEADRPLPPCSPSPWLRKTSPAAQPLPLTCCVSARVGALPPASSASTGCAAIWRASTATAPDRRRAPGDAAAAEAHPG